MASAIVADDFSPIYVGDTSVPFAPVFANANGTAVNLAGASFAMKMVNINTGSIKNCNSAQWTVDNAAGGKAHYQWSSTDVDTPGIWQLYVTVTIGGLPVHGDAKELQILPVPFLTRTIVCTAALS